VSAFSAACAGTVKRTQSIIDARTAIARTILISFVV
jgi:hypothetical protein